MYSGTIASIAAGAKPSTSGKGQPHTLSIFIEARLSRVMTGPGRCSSTNACASAAQPGSGTMQPASALQPGHEANDLGERVGARPAEVVGLPEGARIVDRDRHRPRDVLHPDRLEPRARAGERHDGQELHEPGEQVEEAVVAARR